MKAFSDFERRDTLSSSFDKNWHSLCSFECIIFLPFQSNFVNNKKGEFFDNCDICVMCEIFDNCKFLKDVTGVKHQFQEQVAVPKQIPEIKKMTIDQRLWWYAPTKGNRECS